MADLIDSILDRPAAKVLPESLPIKPKTTTSAIRGVPFKRLSPGAFSGSSASASSANKGAQSSAHSSYGGSRGAKEREPVSRNVPPKRVLTELEKRKRKEQLAMLREANRGDVSLQSVAGVVHELESALTSASASSASGSSAPASYIYNHSYSSSAVPAPVHSRSGNNLSTSNHPTHPQRPHPAQAHMRGAAPHSSRQGSGAPLTFPTVVVPDFGVFVSAKNGGRGAAQRPKAIAGGKVLVASAKKPPREQKPKPVIIGGVVQPPRPAAKVSAASNQTRGATCAAPNLRGMPQPSGVRDGNGSSAVMNGGGRVMGHDRTFMAQRQQQHHQLGHRQPDMMVGVYNDSDEEEEDDLDDFIDDGPNEGMDWRSQLRSVTGYDPRAFGGLDEGEAAESSAGQQAFEERKSAKVAQREDAEELKRIREEEAREALNRKRRKR